MAQHRLSLRRGRVARADADGHGCRGVAQLPSHLRDLLERLLEVGVNIDGQRLQRTEVHDLRYALDRLAGLVFSIQRVNRGQEPGECLARARRRANQRVLTGNDRRPAPRLRLRRAARKPALKPQPHRGMKPLENFGGTGRIR